MPAAARRRSAGRPSTIQVLDRQPDDQEAYGDELPRLTEMIARLLEPALPGKVARVTPLRWNIAPQNVPYAIQAGLQPELVSTGSTLRGRLAPGSAPLALGAVVSARRADEEWELAALDDRGT